MLCEKCSLVYSSGMDFEKALLSTKRVIGCGKKMDALGYIICGEFDDLKHGGKQWLCEDCEKLNKSETEKHGN